MSGKPSPQAVSLKQQFVKRPGARLEPVLGVRDLANILDSLSLPVFASNRLKRLVYVNQAACRVLGKPADALLGTPEALFFLPPTGVEKNSCEHVLEWNGREHVVWILRDAFPHNSRSPSLNAGHIVDVTALRDTELACALHQKRLEALVDKLPLLLRAHDEDGRIVFWNSECVRVLGYPAREVLGRTDIFERLYPDSAYRDTVRGWHKEAKGYQERETRMRTRDGNERVIAWTQVRQAQPVTGWTSWESGVDVTDRRTAQNALREAECRADALFRNSPLGVHFYRLTPSGRLLLVAANPASDRILRRDQAQLVGQPLEAAFPEISGPEVRERLTRACCHGESWRTGEHGSTNVQISGAFELHCFQTEPGVCACMFQDHSELKRLETRLRHQALHDPLTGIANRSLCVERIDTALQRVRRRADYRYAVIFLDLDRFKLINDTLGHTAGDAVLVETAARLRGAVRELDTVARMGGDEFVVVMEEFDSYKRPIQAIRRIREALQAPIQVHGQELTITASLGLALGQTPSDSAEEVCASHPGHAPRQVPWAATRQELHPLPAGPDAQGGAPGKRDGARHRAR